MNDIYFLKLILLIITRRSVSNGSGPGWVCWQLECVSTRAANRESKLLACRQRSSLQWLWFYSSWCECKIANKALHSKFVKVFAESVAGRELQEHFRSQRNLRYNNSKFKHTVISGTRAIRTLVTWQLLSCKIWKMLEQGKMHRPRTWKEKTLIEHNLGCLLSLLQT